MNNYEMWRGHIPFTLNGGNAYAFNHMQTVFYVTENWSSGTLLSWWRLSKTLYTCRCVDRERVLFWNVIACTFVWCHTVTPLCCLHGAIFCSGGGSQNNTVAFHMLSHNTQSNCASTVCGGTEATQCASYITATFKTHSQDHDHTASVIAGFERDPTG